MFKKVAQTDSNETLFPSPQGSWTANPKVKDLPNKNNSSDNNSSNYSSKCKN